MKFRTESTEFREAASAALRTVGARATLPALSGVLLKVEGDRLTLSSTDLELASELSIPVSAESDGTTLVPGKLLGDVSRALPAGALEAELIDNSFIRLRCGKSKFDLRVMPAEDFPAIPMPDSGSPTVVLPAEDFARLVDTTAIAASTDDARPVLTGVSLEINDSTLRAAATDSYRLAVDAIPSDASDGTALIPARAFTEAKRAAESGGDIKLVMEPGQVTFLSGDYRLTTRLIEGKFPDWNQLVPKEFERRLEADREELIDVVKRCAIVAEGSATPQVQLDMNGDTINVTAEDRERGNAEESLPGKLEGEPLKIAFNARYLQAGLEATRSERIYMEFRDDLKPAVIRSIPDDNGDDKAKGNEHDYFYLVMPIRL